MSSTPVLRLASASPRRQSLLASIGIKGVIVDPASISEKAHTNESATDLVVRLAREKALDRHQVSSIPTLGADTLIECDQQILGKPQDEADAIAMLTKLSGRAHWVLSAISIVGREGVLERMVPTKVVMRSISMAEMHAYWATQEPCDKAAGYAIQGIAAQFVERIEGSYSAVVGLPLFETAELLKRQGVTLL